MKDEFVSVEHLLLALASLKDGAVAEAFRVGRPHAREAPRGDGGRAGRPARDEPHARGHLRGAREVRTRPHRARPAGQARPGHRPRRGDPPRDPDPLAAHQEQPGADRLARRGQDGDRGGAGPAHRAGRRARGAQGQAHRDARHGRAGGRRQVPRRVRGAAQGRAQGGAGRRRARSSSSSTSCTRWWARARPRAPWTPATCSSRCWRAASSTASARPRSTSTSKHIEKDAALERRFQPVMVDQPTVEDTISILRGLQGALRGPPRRADQGRRPGGGGGPVAPLHHRPVPARQGHRPRGRGGGPPPDGDRLDAGRAGRDHPADHCSSRSSARPCARRPTPPRGIGWRSSRRS